MHKRSKLSLAVVATIAGSLVGPALAQQAVEVTGSRIRIIDQETAQPVIKVTQEQIQATGLVTIADIVTALTSSGSPTFDRGASLNSSRDQGGQYINARNLGTQRLLVLVNGRRWTSSVNGFTDLSTIPSSLVERIEVLKDGASAIYGSDAIAGVVNFILKKDFNGASTSAYYGRNQLGDGVTQTFDYTLGKADDRGSFLLNFSYQKQDPVFARSRDVSATSLPAPYQSAGFGGGPWGRIRDISPAGTATGMDMILKHTGGPAGDGQGENSSLSGSYRTFTGAPEDLFNATSQMMFQQGGEVKTVFARGATTLPADVRFSSNIMFSDRVSENQIAGYPMNSLAQPGFPVYVDRASYFNPFGVSAVGEANAKNLFFFRRTIEVPRRTTNNNRLFHLDAVFDGEFNLGKNPWSWSVAYNFNKADGVATNYGNLNLVNLRSALGPSFADASGAVFCGRPGAVITGCVPFNILGGPSASTPAALDYVMAVVQATYGSQVTSLQADLSGSVARLPAGDVQLALGAENREVRGYDMPGALDSAGLSTNLAGRATNQSYSVKEFYGELQIPLIKDAAWMKSASANVASRFSDYSNFGSTTNSKASLTLRPTRDFLVRGTFAQGFRAPTISDYAGGGSQSFDTYLDPCDTRFGAAASNPAVAASCLASGVPAGFRQTLQSGAAIAASNGGQTTVPFFTGVGNANLQPETAITRTFGLVMSPSAIPRFSASVDWFDIDVSNRIAGLTANYILDQCLRLNVQDFCNRFTRDSSGKINSLTRGNTNLGELQTSGYDVAMSYQLAPTAAGVFSARMESTFVTRFATKSTPTASFVESTNTPGLYKHRTNFTFGWKKNNLNGTAIVRRYAASRDVCLVRADPAFCSNPNDISPSGSTGYNSLGPLTFLDLNLRYSTPWKGTAMIGINNATGVKPRYNNTAFSDATRIDANLPIDRFFYARYTQSF